MKVSIKKGLYCPECESLDYYSIDVTGVESRTNTTINCTVCGKYFDAVAMASVHVTTRKIEPPDSGGES